MANPHLPDDVGALIAQARDTAKASRFYGFGLSPLLNDLADALERAYTIPDREALQRAIQEANDKWVTTPGSGLASQFIADAILARFPAIGRENGSDGSVTDEEAVAYATALGWPHPTRPLVVQDAKREIGRQRAALRAAATVNGSEVAREAGSSALRAGEEA